jgi:hypothetical protein
MTRETHNSSFDDLGELRTRFEDFRSQHQTRTRLPEGPWWAAAEIARRCGANRVCRCLRLDANGLSKWMGKGVSGARPKYARRRQTGESAAVLRLCRQRRRKVHSVQKVREWRDLSMRKLSLKLRYRPRRVECPRCG